MWLALGGNCAETEGASPFPVDNPPLPCYNVPIENEVTPMRHYGLIGEKLGHSYEVLENRVDDLYGLFADRPEPAGAAAHRRVTYQKG